jgi:hypothetical protein
MSLGETQGRNGGSGSDRNKEKACQMKLSESEELYYSESEKDESKSQNELKEEDQCLPLCADGTQVGARSSKMRYCALAKAVARPGTAVCFFSKGPY